MLHLKSFSMNKKPITLEGGKIVWIRKKTLSTHRKIQRWHKILRGNPNLFMAYTGQVWHGETKIWVIRSRSFTWTSHSMPVKSPTLDCHNVLSHPFIDWPWPKWNDFYFQKRFRSKWPLPLQNYLEISYKVLLQYVYNLSHAFQTILLVLAPCQWGSLPDPQPHALMINYSTIVWEFGQDLLVPLRSVHVKSQTFKIADFLGIPDKKIDWI